MDQVMMTHAMRDSISEVLEQMFFLPIDFIDAQQVQKDASADPEAIMSTTVGFSGSPSGRFRLTLPKVLAADVTADFLGVQPDTLSHEEVSGTVKEMVNMLAGSTLSTYAPQAVFDLGIPEMIPSSQPAEVVESGWTTLDIGIQTLESRMSLQLVSTES